MAETVEAGAPDDTGIADSFADEVGALLGEAGDVSDDFPDTADGTESSESAKGPAATAPQSEGQDADAERTGAPPAAAAVADPDSEVPAVQTPDLLQNAAPLDYAVNGQSRSADGIRVLKDGDTVLGAVVDAEYLPTLAQRLSERDHLYEQSQTEYAKTRELERITSWTYKDREGKDQTATGRQGVALMRDALYRTTAELNELRTVLKDPQAVLALLEPDPTTGAPAISQAALTYLQTRIENATIKASNLARSDFMRAATEPPPAPVAPADYARQHAATALESIVREHQVKGLTPDDTQWLIGQAPFYARVENGQTVLDRQYLALVQRTANDRQAQSKIATDAGRAGSDNAARLAAAAVPRTTQPAAAPPKPAKPISRAEQSEANRSDYTNRFLRAAAKATRSA